MVRLLPLACVVALPFAALARAPRPAPTLTLVRPGGARQYLVFAGSGAGPVHRAGPEHFKLTQVTDGRPVALRVAYDREALDARDEGVGCPRTVKVQAKRQVRELRPYNALFKGARLFLASGRPDAKDTPGRNGYLDLFGRADLRPGVRYRLTWACRPVGAREATEVSCEFTAGK